MTKVNFVVYQLNIKTVLQLFTKKGVPHIIFVITLADIWKERGICIAVMTIGVMNMRKQEKVSKKILQK